MLRIIGVMALFLLVMKIPFDFLLEFLFSDEQKIFFINKILFSVIIICYTIFLIRKYRFQFITGLSKPRLAVVYMYFLPLYILFFNDFSNLKNLTALDLIIPFIGILLHAFAEELTFRGIVLPTLLENNSDSVKKVKKAIIIGALIFGLAHFISLFKYDLISVLYQVIYAMIFGLFFNILLVKGNNIYFLGIIHGLVNFGSGINAIGYQQSVENPDEGSSGILSIVVAIFIVFLPLLLVGFFMLNRIIEKDIARLNRQYFESNNLQEEIN